MEPMTLDELMEYWLEKSEYIALDKSLDYKERYYSFIDAYTTHLFYRNAVNELYDEAKGEAVAWGLTGGIFD